MSNKLYLFLWKAFTSLGSQSESSFSSLIRVLWRSFTASLLWYHRPCQSKHADETLLKSPGLDMSKGSTALHSPPKAKGSRASESLCKT